MKFQKKFERISFDLENERKIHAEELRLINQDINHLEDILKSTKSSQDVQKKFLRQKFLIFKKDLFFLNKFFFESGISEKNFLSFDMFQKFDFLEVKNLPNFKNFENQNFELKPNLGNLFLNPGFPTTNMPMGNGMVPRQFGTFFEDTSKMKVSTFNLQCSKST